MQNNQTRFEFTANVDELQIATERLKELKALQIALAQEAQRGEKTITEAITAQSTARKEQLGIEKLLREAAKQTGAEHKATLAAVTASQNTVIQGQSRMLGLLEEERAKLKGLKTAREQAQTTAEVDKYNAAIKQSQTEINKLTGATDKFRGSNGFWQETRQLIVGAFAVSSIVDFTKSVFNAGTQIDGFKLSLNRLVGEAEAVKIYKELSKAIVDTPLEFEGATKSLEKLIFAYQDAKAPTTNIVKDFVAFGNVTKGNAENLNSLSKVLADTGAAGKATAQEFNQARDAGVNLFDALERSTGKSRQELLKMREDGLITFDLLRDALVQAGSEGGRFFNAMSVKMVNTGGVYSQFADALFLGFGRISDAFKDNAIGVLKWGTSLINTFLGSEEAVKNTINVVKTAVTTWSGYKALMAGVELAKKGYLVYQGLLILAKEQETAAILANTAAQGGQAVAVAANTTVTIAATSASIQARVAALAFSRAIATLGPMALVTAAVWLLVEAYDAITEKQENAQKVNYDWIKSNDDAIKSVREGDIRMGLAFDKVTKLKEGTELHTEALKELIKTYPELFPQLTAETTKHSDLVAIYDSLAKSKDIQSVKIREQIANLLKLGEGTDAYKKGLNTLINTYPEYFTKLNTEKDKNVALRNIYNEVNAAIERKISLMAAEKTAQATTNRLVEIQQELTQRGVTTTDVKKYNKDKNGNSVNAPSFASIKDIQLLQEYANLVKAAGQAERNVLNQRNKNFNIEHEALKNAQNTKLITHEQYLVKLDDLKLKYNLKAEKQEETANNTSVAGTVAAGKKVAKEKIDSAETLLLIQKKADLESLEQHRDIERLKLLMEQGIALQRIEDSKDSEEKKASEIFKVVEKHKTDLSKLEKKFADEDEKAFKKQQDNSLKLSDAINKALEKQKIDKLERDYKLAKKYAEEGLKLDENIAKKQADLDEEQLVLSDKLRLLDRISTAKNATEIVKIKKDEQQKILQETVTYYKNILFLATIDLQKTKMLKGEHSIEYKKQKEVVLVLEKEYTEAQGKLIEQQTKNVEDGVDKQKAKQKEAIGYMMAVADEVFGLIERSLEKQLSATDNLVTQAQIKNQQQGIAIAKQGMSAITSFATGDIAGGITKTIGVVFNGIDLIVNASKRTAEAAILQSRAVLRRYLDFISDDIDTFINSLEKVKDIYGDLKDTKGASFIVKTNLETILGLLGDYNKIIDEMKNSESIVAKIGIDLGDFGIENMFTHLIKDAERLGFSIGDLINAEVSRAEKIKSTYDTAVDKENDFYELAVSNTTKVYDDKIKKINEAYDAEIKRINDKYDYESIKASQQYNAQTLAITAAGKAQLEALITNEALLASVRKEFANKRIEIEKAFPLAAVAITEGMSEAEISAINASITARDAALAKLQAGYNAELATIINSEGQKRKEYTATEAIQNTIQANLDAAALKFQGEEIQRAKDKAIAIEAAEATKRTNTEIATIAHNAILLQYQTAHTAALTKLNDDYTKAIADSYNLLTALLIAQQKQIEGQMSATANKGTEEYQKLEQQLYRVKAALDAITASSGTINLNVNTNGGTQIAGFAEGTERVPSLNRGVDKHIIAVDDNERILKGTDNNKLRSYFGKDIKNEDLIRIATTQVPKFVNYSITPTGNINELISREMKVQVNMQLDGMRKAFENNSASVVKAINEKAETKFFADGNGFHKTTRKNNMSINEKISNYFG